MAARRLIALRIDGEKDDLLKTIARRERCTKSDVIRVAVDTLLVREIERVGLGSELAGGVAR